MSNLMPCGLDDPNLRFEADGEEEVLSEAEKRISWIFSEWQEALENDDLETWRDIRMMTYGAKQTFVRVSNRYDDYALMDSLNDLAFEHSLDCIRRGKYEGATK